MEQIIETAGSPETIDFGGIEWVKRSGCEETYNAHLPTGGYVYVARYETGRWNWQRMFEFDFAREPQFFSDRASDIVDTRDEAMAAALAADKSAYIAELVDALMAAGFIAADSNYQRGFRDGQLALKTVIAGLEEEVPNVLGKL